MSNNQNNPYMGNLAAMGINPSQIPPALYQQFMQQQQQQQQQQPAPQQPQQQFPQMMNNGIQAQNSMGFNGLHQTYQRLQSQEAAKLDQQRLGMGLPGTAPPGQYQQLLALQTQGGNPTPNGNMNNMVNNFAYPQQNIQQPAQQIQQQQQPNQMNMGQNMGQQNGANMGFNLAQIQQLLQQQSQAQQQQMQQGGQAPNALGIGGMGMNHHSQSQGLNLQSGVGDSEQGRRQQALQSMLQTQGIPNPQANMYPNPTPGQQFQPSPNVQANTMSLPPNPNPNMNQSNNHTAQQLEQFFRNHPEIEKTDRQHAINQLMLRAKQNGANVDMGSLAQSQAQPQQNQQQQQRPHPVGLNGFTPQVQSGSLPNQNMGQPQLQRPMPNQPIPQNSQPQQPQPPQMQRPDSFTLGQQNMQYPGAGDTQRQIEAAMKQRQRSGLVTPQNNGNALPLPSPQIPGQPLQPGGITPNHHNRTLSQSSSIHPGIPQPPQPIQQQQQSTNQANNIFATVQGWSNDHLEKATASMLSKFASFGSNPQAAQGKATLMSMVSEYKRRLMTVPQPLLDGLEKVFPGNVGHLMAMDHPALQSAAFSQMKNVNARQMQAQQQAAMQQSQNRQAQANMSQMGSAANPVDITTPQVNANAQLNSNIPSFAQQQSGTFAPPPPPQRQPSSGPASGLTNPQQWTQQQAGQQQVQSANRGKAWAGHDFAKSNFPIPEDKFMGYLSQMLNIPNFTPPMIQNRAVDLYALFNLVHKNGGSVKLEGNVPVWSQIAGVLGFGETTQSGPAPRSTPQIAIQISIVHAKFLSRLEDMFYSSQLNERIKAQGGQATQLPNAQPPQQAQPQISTQFLEAVARGGNGVLNEQQKKALEGRKPLVPGQGQGQIRQPLNTDVGLLQAMKQNPKMATFWVKSKEEGMRQRLMAVDANKGAKFGTVPDELKAKTLADLQGLPQLAGDAQSKMPKMFMVAVERATNPSINSVPNDDAALLLQVIQFYTTIQIITSQATQNQFMSAPPDLMMLRDRITSILNRFSNFMSELLSNPETAPSLQRLLAAVEQGPASVGPASASRQSPAMEDLASKLPKGLRVEDLKPPPSKRQKNKSGQSPAVQTPDNPKTPSVAADSPAGIPGSAQSKKGVPGAATAGNNKRKRQASNAAGLKTPKFVAPAIPKIETSEDPRHKAFFEAQAALANGTADPWAALTSAMEDFQAARAEFDPDPEPLSVKPYTATSASTAAAPAPAKSTRSGPSDEELFAEFMDFDNTYFPTPELLVDLVDDYSPESIRTVGRGESVIGSVRAAPWPLEPETPVKEELAQDQVKDQDPEDNLTFMSVPQSPASAAYNGGLVFC